MPATIDFRMLVARSPNAYVVLDRELRLVWMNDAYLKATMRTREELVGRTMFEAFPSDPDSESYKLLEGSLRRVLDTGQTDELALIRYDISRPDGGMDQRYWSATHTPLHDADGEVRHILQHTVDVTELESLRAMRDEMGVVQRANAVQARNLDLSQESEQLKALFDQAPGFMAVLSGPRHEVRLANRAYLRLVGQRNLIGRPVAEALPEIVAQGFIALLDTVRESGRPYVGRNQRILLANEGAGGDEERFLDFIYQPIFDGAGAVTGIFVQGNDVTEQVQAQEQQELLIHELNHRVKNTLAVVQGLATQSFRGIPGSEQARTTFDARLTALAAAHSLLTAQSWQAARLIDTVRSAIEATAGSDSARFHLAGPDIRLPPQAAMAMAMVVHELSTNAIKYGALSAGEGRVDLAWSVEEEEHHCRLAIEWRERGGPPVEPPTRRGFGTRLIQRGIAPGLGGAVALHFEPEGLRCTIDARIPKSPA
ncbi:sensor histidine kinase [Sphingobium lignivorans]|uniref:histidine kinase n=1 Tax=Sphingobium lignivorans TaxID=2735886 RepID=A0ABR6NL61_9SPHN|nr:PAS domain-containing protein [Sphingobium lignivorans]MBB5988009.1 PAS domain S-box-containing protein [Sphingobium lignivorans]